MGTTPLITTNNPQNTRSTKPDQANTTAGANTTADAIVPKKCRTQFPLAYFKY